MAVDFEATCCGTGLGDYRPCRGTYEYYPYSSVPILDASRFTGAFDWIPVHGTIDPAKGALLADLDRHLAAVGIALPLDFVKYHSYTDLSQTLVAVSGTGCFSTLLGPSPAESEEFLIRFLNYPIPSPVEPGAFLAAPVRFTSVPLESSSAGQGSTSVALFPTFTRISAQSLDRVRPADFHYSLGERFKDRMDPRTFHWLAQKPAHGAVPHHNFHVYDVYIRAGLMRDERIAIALETMDACRVSWGKVVALDGAELVVQRPALGMREGKLVLTEPRIARVTHQIDGQGFADEAQPGDHVSIHWNWACEVLSPSALRRLQQLNRRCMALANETL